MKLSKPRLLKMASKPFGPWEHRDISAENAIRPERRHYRPVGYLNNRYSVQISDEATEWGLVAHLWIRRHDGEMVRSWSDLQRIKNELIGEERVAVEVFPTASNLVDEANMAHLWVLPEGFSLPFSLKKSIH